MTIREATADDIEGLSRVAKASWDADYPDILTSESLREGFEEWYSESQVRESLNWANTLILVAEKAGTIAGFAHAVWERDESGETATTDTSGDILRVYVHPEYRREGLGQQLFEKTRDELTRRGVSRLRAMTLEANDVGNEFYRQLDFELVDTEQVSIGDESYRENTYAMDLETAN